MARLERDNGEQHELSGELVRVGRDRVNDLVLADDPKVSRSHAEFRCHDDQWTLVDLDSRNGTKVNRRKVSEHPLKDRDRVQFGGTMLTFLADDDPNATEADVGVLASGPELSERERQVLALVSQGLTDREVAKRLFISTSTVRSHLDRISEKTGLRRRAELTRLALAMKLGS